MSSEAFKEPMQRLVEELQEQVCADLEALEPDRRFREDVWKRQGGGGGSTRVLEDGEVLEKAGVNTSTVFGEIDESFAQEMRGEGRSFFATGLSIVLHPRNPLVPATHANFRYVVVGGHAWFGGGADLTPCYLFEEDARHFHRTLKAACGAVDPSAYPRFKKACDDYFFLPHRGEARGVGGIFFEDLEVDLSRQFDLVLSCARAYLPAYLPIIERRKAMPFTGEQRLWQEIRRGRYVEFNLLYDRGTDFGLRTRGRTESILISMPPRVRWVYDHRPAHGSSEERLVEVLRHPREWAD